MLAVVIQWHKLILEIYAIAGAHQKHTKKCCANHTKKTTKPQIF